jgi:hypothetical protein
MKEGEKGLVKLCVYKPRYHQPSFKLLVRAFAGIVLDGFTFHLSSIITHAQVWFVKRGERQRKKLLRITAYDKIAHIIYLKGAIYMLSRVPCITYHFHPETGYFCPTLPRCIKLHSQLHITILIPYKYKTHLRCWVATYSE